MLAFVRSIFQLNNKNNKFASFNVVYLDLLFELLSDSKPLLIHINHPPKPVMEVYPPISYT